MLASGALLPGVAVLLGLAALAALAPRTRFTPRGLSLALSALACLGILGLGVAVLVTGEPVTARDGSVLGFALIDVRFDSALRALPERARCRGCRQLRLRHRLRGPRIAGRSTAHAVAYPVFLAGMLLVFGASDAFAFLLAWEVMALARPPWSSGRGPIAAVAAPATSTWP